MLTSNDSNVDADHTRPSIFISGVDRVVKNVHNAVEDGQMTESSILKKLRCFGM